MIGWSEVEGSGVGMAAMHDTDGNDQQADILLEPMWPSYGDGECLLSVLLHEFGHLLGLDHQDDESSIMAPNTSCATEVSMADIKAVRFLYTAATE